MVPHIYLLGKVRKSSKNFAVIDVSLSTVNNYIITYVFDKSQEVAWRRLFDQFFADKKLNPTGVRFIFKTPRWEKYYLFRQLQPAKQGVAGATPQGSAQAGAA